MPRVIVVGGGLAGLATAYFLGQRAEVTVLEAAPRAGGKLLTEARDGFLLEGGPDAFVTYKPAALELCRELGLELIETLPARPRSLVLDRGRLTPVPEGLMGVIPSRWLPMALTPLLSWTGKLRMLADLWLPARRESSEESLAEFLRRRLGGEIVERLADPLLAGIYGAPADCLSSRCLFPRLLALEEKHRSLIMGVLRQPSRARGPEMLGLRAGMSGLTEALQARVNGRLRVGQQVEQVLPGQVRVGGEWVQADQVVLATPAPQTARLLGPGALSEQLASIAYQKVATVALGFHRRQVIHPLDSHGFVVPTRQAGLVSACTWSSSKFPGRVPASCVLLRAYVRNPQDSDEELVEGVVQELRPLLKLIGQPRMTRVFRWENPVYRVGHGELVSGLDRHVPAGLFLTGSAYRGVGVPDVIEQARSTAERVAQAGLG